MKTLKRETFKLTPEEATKFRRLPPLPGAAFEFWQVVAHQRNLDYKTIIGTDTEFTALPLDHGKHWCWPSPLKCVSLPPKN